LYPPQEKHWAYGVLDGRQVPKIVSWSPSRAALMNCVVKASVTLSRRAVAVSEKAR